MLQRRTSLATYLFKHGKSLYGGKNFHLTSSVLIRKRGATKKTSSELDSFTSEPVNSEFPVPRKTTMNANFYGVESDEGVIDIEQRSRNTILEQDVFISKLNNKFNQEKVKNTRFGTIRWDNENKPMLYSGENTKSHVDKNSNTYSKRILQPLHTSENQVNHLSDSEVVNDRQIYAKCEQNSDAKIGASYIDDIYFGNEAFDVKSRDKHDFKPTSSKMVDYLDQVKTPFLNEVSNSKSSSDFVENLSSDSKNKDNIQGTMDNLGFLDELYFKNESVKNANDGYSNNPKHSTTNVENEGFSFIDESYFDSNLIRENKHSNKDLEENVDFHARSIKSPPIVSNSVEYDNFSEIKFEKPIVQNEPKNIKYATKDQLNNSESNHEFQDVNTDFVLGNFKHTTNSPILSVDDHDKTSNSIEENYITQSPITNYKVNDLLNHTVVTKVKEKSSGSFKANFSENIQRDQKSLEKNREHSSNKTRPTLQEIKKDEVNSFKDVDTAHDFVQKLRSEREEYRPIIKGGKFLPPEAKQDSKGFRILSSQVPNLSLFTKDEIMQILKNSVLYSDEDIVVLNKPYNLVIHDSETTKDPALSEYLNELAVALDDQSQDPKLITVHRIDKETCGCLLLARNDSAAQRLRALFSQRKIVKTYWIVTIAVPDPLEGVIDIPIAEGSVGKMKRMVLHPNLSKEIGYASHSRHGKRAVTYYKVISTSGSAAIVEVQPETGLKHQIRVHFGFGLSCPILGDHKYSYLNKMAPQKLPNDMLQKLCIRQSKVRHVPMHIYSRSILIPQYRDGRNLFVMAPMPTHISMNLQQLNFKKNKN